MKKSQESLTTIVHWLDWRATCAYDLCSAETKEVFNEFALRSFRAKLPKNVSTKDIMKRFHGGGREIWKLLEGQVYTKKTKNGIPYKRHLFQKTLSSKILPEAYVCTMFRDVVRDWLKNEGPSLLTRSLDEPLYPDQGGKEITLQDKDLLPRHLYPSWNLSSE